MDGKSIGAIFRPVTVWSGIMGIYVRYYLADAGQPPAENRVDAQPDRCCGWWRYANCLLCISINIIKVNTQM